MLKQYRSRSDSISTSGKKRSIIIVIGIVFAVSLVFVSGYIVGVKAQARRDSLLLRTQNYVQKPQIGVPPIGKENSDGKKIEVVQQAPDKNPQKSEQIISQTKTKVLEEKHPRLKESEGQKPKKRDLTFYRTLTTKKKQATVGLEPDREKRNKTNGPTEKSENPNKIYTVQVGAYKEMAVAEKVRNKLKIKGYPAYIVEKEIPQEGTIYKVRVGELPNRDKAEEIAKRINEKEGMPTFVTLK